MTIERLSADDRLLLLPDEAWPQDVGIVAVLDASELRDVPDPGGFPVDLVREAVAEGLAGLPRLRQVLRVPPRGLGGPFWVDVPSFDLAQHVRLGPRLASGDDAGLLDVVEQLRSHRLDPSRPLWELWLLPGLDGGRVGVFVRMHHVMADGVAGVASLVALLGGGHGDRARTPWAPRPAPTNGALLADSLRRRAHGLAGAIARCRHPGARLRAATEVVRAARELVAGQPGPVTSLGGLVGPHRRLALVRAPFEDVQAVAHAHRVTINDVLLAMITGGVRALLASRGEALDGLALPILVPVSLRRGANDKGFGNRISQMAVELPVGEEDGVERLRRVSTATSRAKALDHPPMTALMRNAVLTAITLRLIIRRRINLLSADLPGPRQPLSVAGAPVLEAFPLINLVGNVTLGVGALSYAGGFNVLAVADGDLYPDLEVFAAAAAEEIRVLGATANVSTREGGVCRSADSAAYAPSRTAPGP